MLIVWQPQVTKRGAELELPLSIQLDEVSWTERLRGSLRVAGSSTRAQGGCVFVDLVGWAGEMGRIIVSVPHDYHTCHLASVSNSSSHLQYSF